MSFPGLLLSNTVKEEREEVAINSPLTMRGMKEPRTNSRSPSEGGRMVVDLGTKKLNLMFMASATSEPGPSIERHGISGDAGTKTERTNEEVTVQATITEFWIAV
ncbi:uncharacterized protein EI90DRAFT_654485 [Cantharellus anzutake]|uniref:uncharacterized protein n=1 Tax=Cantharellus anzutake TaxID=1750568 RepID=UPI0019034FB2|nr:uncharacterized protein EI90DRAFT_654485 [Cantharellus anzutake]KAF8312612.1 hypothetical protein EI90DRAFT_654485 [Cantharellus anzutake]